MAQRKRSPAGIWVRNLCECFPSELERMKENLEKCAPVNVLMHFCVCERTKAWKVAPFTWPHVFSVAMCQLTEGTHAPLYSGLSSGPTLCLFFLQWTGSSVYSSHPKPSLQNILPATAARHTKAALTSPKSPSLLNLLNISGLSFLQNCFFV